jgi:hypothetical protein
VPLHSTPLQSTHATFSGEGINTVCWKISGLLFGGTTIPDAWNSNPEQALAFRAKVQATFSATLTGKTKDSWQPVVAVEQDKVPNKVALVLGYGLALADVRLLFDDLPCVIKFDVGIMNRSWSKQP